MGRKKEVSKEALLECLEGNLSSEQMRAKLKIGKHLLIRSIKEHGLFDLHREKLSNRFSEKSKQRWSDPEHKAKISKNLKETCSNPEFRKKRSEISKQMWTDPSHKEKVSQKMKEVWSDPEHQEKMLKIRSTEEHRTKMSEVSKEVWSDLGRRERMSEVSKEVWSDPEHQEKMKEVWSDPERRAKLSAIKKEMWTDPSRKESHTQRMKEMWSDSEHQEKMKEVWSNPELRNRQSEVQKSFWSDPEHREKMMAICNSVEVRTKQALARENQKGSLTKPHLKVMALLDTLGFAYKPEHPVGPYNFDIFVPAANLLIEVQGDYWHSLSKAQRNDQSKASYIANLKDYTLKHIWEHELLTEGSALAKLKYWLGAEVQRKDFDKKQMAVIQPEVKEADKFLYDFHYQHSGKHGVDFAGYLDGQIVVLARFSAPTRKEIATSMGYEFKQVLELTRLCVHPVYQQKNLLSWFLARCEGQIRKEHPQVKCLVSFADKTHNHTGVVYRASNWKLEHIVEPNYWYVNSEGWVMHKKTLWNHARSLKLSENEFAEQNGYKKVWGMEKLKFSRSL